MGNISFKVLQTSDMIKDNEFYRTSSSVLQYLSIIISHIYLTQYTINTLFTQYNLPFKTLLTFGFRYDKDDE